MGAHQPQPRQYWLLTYPRTGSNLLVNILGLEEQPNIMQGHVQAGYYFLPVLKLMTELNLLSRGVQEWTENERKQMKECYQNCFDTLNQHLEDAKKKSCSFFVKEHCNHMAHPNSTTEELSGATVDEAPWMVDFPQIFGQLPTRSTTNETVLPDGFLRQWSPTFLIRHPALAFPSCYRAFLGLNKADGDSIDGDQGTIGMTLRWSRLLYEWYSDNLIAQEAFIDGDATWPLVLDGDDVMSNRDVVLRFGEILQLDKKKMRFSWEPVSGKELAEMDIRRKRFLSTLLGSAGIIKGKTAENLDIEVEVKKWQKEFGEKVAIRLEELVRTAMPDYEFLNARKLKAKNSPLAV
jgi:hypothetical protein